MNDPTQPEWYQLRSAVWERDFEAAQSLLQTYPALRILRNGIGETVLHFLAVENDLEGVAWLRSNGFSLDEKNAFGSPLIFEVAQLGYKELLRWLIQNGVDLSARDRYGNNIHEYLAEYEQHKMLSVLNDLLR